MRRAIHAARAGFRAAAAGEAPPAGAGAARKGRRRGAPAGTPVGATLGVRRAEFEALARRDFHGTARKEVLPIIAGGIAVAVVATGLRYLIRAGKRMKEMEDLEKEQRGSGAGAADGGAAVNVGGSNGEPAGPAVGVDVGTTNLRMAFSSSAGGKVDVVENKEGARMTPAVVSYAAAGGADGTGAVVGRLAHAQRWQAPSQTFFGLQPFLGVAAGSERASQLASRVAWRVAEPAEGQDAGNGELAVEAGWTDSGTLSLEDVTAEMLRSMRDLRAAKVAGGAVGGSTMLSTPAYFSEAQCKALVSAAEKADLHTVLGTVPEPLAAVSAALELGFLKDNTAQGLVAVLDAGGRSIQCSVVDLAGTGGGQGGTNSSSPFLGGAVVGTAHCEETGGEFFQEAIVRHIAARFKRDQKVDLMQDPLALTRMHEAAEHALMELSQSMTSAINIPFITADQTGPKHLQDEISRAQLERIIDELLFEARAPCKDALSTAGVAEGGKGLSAVLLVGGCARMAAVQAMVRDNFGGAANGVLVPELGEELVTIGATIAARKAIYET